jgi:hypothetical protein
MFLQMGLDRANQIDPPQQMTVWVARVSRRHSRQLMAIGEIGGLRFANPAYFIVLPRQHPDHTL